MTARHSGDPTAGATSASRCARTLWIRPPRDDILDDFDSSADIPERGEQLQHLSTQLFDALLGRDCDPADPTLTAVVDTARKYGIGWDLFDDFLASMRMDLSVSDYPNRAALERYMYGSARVIGFTAADPGTVVPREDAARTRPRSKAFQLGRISSDARRRSAARARCIYPPTNLPRTASTGELLAWCQSVRRTDPRGARRYANNAIASGVWPARYGIEMLSPASRPCVATALVLPSGDPRTDRGTWIQDIPGARNGQSLGGSPSPESSSFAPGRYGSAMGYYENGRWQ